MLHLHLLWIWCVTFLSHWFGIASGFTISWAFNPNLALLWRLKSCAILLLWIKYSSRVWLGAVRVFKKKLHYKFSTKVNIYNKNMNHNELAETWRFRAFSSAISLPVMGACCSHFIRFRLTVSLSQLFILFSTTTWAIRLNLWANQWQASRPEEDMLSRYDGPFWRKEMCSSSLYDRSHNFCPPLPGLGMLHRYFLQDTSRTEWEKVLLLSTPAGGVRTIYC